MEQERDLQVIFIKDLLFAALYQWRRILIAALVFAILLAGVAAVFQWKNTSPAQPEQLQTEEDAYQKQKLLLETKRDHILKLMDSQQTYNATSPLMLLDPCSVYKATVQLVVQTDYQILPGMTYQNPDNTDAILQAYAVHLKGEDILQSAAETLKLDTKHLSELILVEQKSGSIRSLAITVYFYNAEGAEQILSAVTNCVLAAKPQIEQAVGAHSINTVSSGVSEQIDLTLADKQTAAITRVDTLKKSLADIETQLSALQAPVFSGNGFSFKTILIFSVIGAILGAGLTACIVWVRHIAGTKVYSARTLKNRTGMRILACVPTADKQNPIDRWLNKLEGRSLDENQAVLAAAAIRNYCLSGKKVLITCDRDCTSPAFTDAMEKAGVQAIFAGSLMQDAAAVEALPGCDAVVLLAKCGCTANDTIERSMELIADQDKQLLGCVLLGG